MRVVALWEIKQLGFFTMCSSQSIHSLRSKRKCTGSASVEMSICISIIMVMVGFPLMDMVYIATKFALASAACGAAARAAASAPAFVQNQRNTLSAVNAAKAAAEEWRKSFSAFEVKQMVTAVAPAPIMPGMDPPPDILTPLTPQTLKPMEFVYQYKVSMDVLVEPMITFNGVFFGHIPGLTEPVTLKCVASRVCEKPEGLLK